MKLLILFTALLVASITGCGTNAPTKAAQGEQILITVVNDGMQQWAAFVNAGKATQSQINIVHTTYDGYYAAQQLAKAVIEKSLADIAQANQAVKDAETALLALLNKYLIK